MGDQDKTQSLLQIISREGLIPTPEEELDRRDVVVQLQQIVKLWAKKVAWQRRIPKGLIARTGAVILTYGSYGLGVYGSSSDIDALCLGPSFASREDDFFIVLKNMLQSRSEVSDVACVTTAKVPLIRFKFSGISVDLDYTRLPFVIINEDMDFFEPYTLTKMDPTSLKSFSGVRCNDSILKQIPNLENFQTVLRAIKLWAKKRGIYSNLNGFLGGVHLVVLVAFVCFENPDDSISVLIYKFFETFANWEWPTPVSLVDEQEYQINETYQSLMPILMPFLPYEVCRSYITRHTFMKIKAELQRGLRLVQAGIKTEAEWANLFDRYNYPMNYHRFVRIFLYAPEEDLLNDWVGYVKSRFHILIELLEKVQGFCDPNPTEYFDPKFVHNKIFYWGLSPTRSNFTDIFSLESEFLKRLRESGVDVYQHRGGRLHLNIVRSSEYGKSDQVDNRRIKACWSSTAYAPPGQPIFSDHAPSYIIGYVGVEPEYM